MYPDQYLFGGDQIRLLAALDAPNRDLASWLACAIDTRPRWDLLKLLKERNVDINAGTPLCDAYGAGRLNVAKVLLQAGANMYIMDGSYDDKDAMYAAIKCNCDAVDQLVNYGYNIRLSHYRYHLIDALRLSFNKFKHVFEKINLGHQLWFGHPGYRASEDTSLNHINKAEHRRFLRFLHQHEFMTQLMVLCVQRTCHNSAVRKLPCDMWRVIGEMSV